MSHQEPEILSQKTRFVEQADGEFTVTIAGIRFEHSSDTPGIGTSRPRVSWRVDTKSANWHQAAYEMEVYDLSGHLRGQTGRVISDQSVLVGWPFAALHSRERLTIRLRVWGTDGQPSG